MADMPIMAPDSIYNQAPPAPPPARDPLMPSDDILSRARSMQDQSAASQRGYDATMTAGLADLKKDEGELAGMRAGRPTPAPVPAAPKSNMGDDAAQWIAAATVMGALAGGTARHANINSLTAFAGVLNGAKEGNQAKFEQSEKEWEHYAKQVSESNKQMLDSYNAILEDKKQSMQEKLLALQLEARKFQDDQTFQHAAMGDYISVAHLMDARSQNQQNWDKWTAQVRRDDKKIAETERHNRVTEGGGVVGDPKAAMETRAQAIAKGALPPITNPRQQLDRATMARVMEINPEFKATDYTSANARARTAGTFSARVDAATEEVAAMVPQAVEASRAFPRGSWVPLNKLVQQYDAGTSDPKYNDFMLANYGLLNAYVRAMNPTGVPRVTERLETHALGILSTATSPETYEVQVNRIIKEVQASRGAINAVRKDQPIELNPVAPRSAPATPAPGWKIEEMKSGDGA